MSGFGCGMDLLVLGSAGFGNDGAIGGGSCTLMFLGRGRFVVAMVIVLRRCRRREAWYWVPRIGRLRAKEEDSR